MRLHIALDDKLVEALDRRVGARQRSAFIAELIRRGLEDEQRWEDIEAALGSLEGAPHDWDEDPRAWVRARRRGDGRRAGWAVARLLLDSTVLIDALRGTPTAERVAALRRAGVEPWVCAISVEEIWRGLRSSEESRVRRLFQGLRVAP